MVSRPRILIVDDDPSDVALVERVLGELGGELEVARDGKAALEQAARRPPDLVLLDVGIPLVDGFTVCRTLKGRDPTRLVPVVFVTGREGLAARLEAIEAGGTDVILKPFDRRELVARVKACLREKELLDARLSAAQAAQPPADPESAPPERPRGFGSYRLVERLAYGGMGEVWRAEHERLKRPAAVKLILPEWDPQGVLARRFEREAQITASLQSPHTVRLFDFGATGDGTLYYVMELLEGVDLESLVKRGGPLPVGRCLHLLRQVCRSLSEAHGLGLIHRDLKPGNVFCCRRVGDDHDVAKVLDFGLAKRGPSASDVAETALTVQGAMIGTPRTVSPEAAIDATSVDARSDLYSLGCVAYYLLTGTDVFPLSSGLQVIVDHVHTEPDPPSTRLSEPLPPRLEELVLACLAKEQDERPASAQELAAALEPLAEAFPWNAADAVAWWDASDAGELAGDDGQNPSDEGLLPNLLS